MKKKTKFRIALVGTNTLRGKEIKNVLSQRPFPLEDIDFYDPDVKEEFSKLTQFKDEPKVIHSLDESSLRKKDLVFLAADRKTNQELGRIAEENSFFAIDLNESFHDRKNIPVIVSGVNDTQLSRRQSFLIANPHPVTIILSHLLHALDPEFGIQKALAFVLEPVSAFDESGIDELASQCVAMLSGESVSRKVFKEQIAFNFLSHVEKPDACGFSPKEKQVVSEVRRVLENSVFPLSVSIVVAPLFHTYAIMSFLELKNDTDLSGLVNQLKKSPILKMSPPEKQRSITSLSVAGKDGVFVGQVKKEEAFPRSFWVWTVTDNLTRGSALNAFEIAKIILSSPPMSEG